MIEKAFLSCLQAVPDHETMLNIGASWHEVLEQLSDDALMPCFVYAQKHRKDSNRPVTASEVFKAWPGVKDEYDSDRGHGRQQFYMVRKCVRCGRVGAQFWKEKFDRFEEIDHGDCVPCLRWLREEQKSPRLMEPSLEMLPKLRGLEDRQNKKLSQEELPF